MTAIERLEGMQTMIAQYLQLYDKVENKEEYTQLAQKLTQLETAISQAKGEPTTSTERTNTTLKKSVGTGGKNERADVRLVQQLLKEKAGYSITVDGWIGPKTIEAIHQFQKSVFNGWSDGLIEAGKTTWQKLVGKASQPSTPTPDPQPSTPTTPKGGLSAAVGEGVVEGNKPADVLLVQQLLNKLKAGLTEDGKIGNNTIQAIKRHQRSIFSGWSDGKIDPGGKTWQALQAGKGSAAVGASSGGAIGPAGSQLFRLGGQQIASIPNGATGTLHLVVLVGGAGKANPEWMLSQTPSTYFKNALVYIIPQKFNYNTAKANYTSFFAGKGLKVSSVSICGFSGGAALVQFASGNFKVKGLIDPYVLPNWVNRNLGSNVIMEYNQYNWGGPYMSTRNALPLFEKAITKNGGYAKPNHSISHMNFPAYFLNKFSSKIL